MQNVGPINAGGDLAAEQRAAHIAALLRERDGYEARQRAYEAGGDKDGAERMKGRIRDVDTSLRGFGEQGKAPSKRAERRPRPQRETR